MAANQSHVPPIGRGSLYLRPLLLGTGPILGLGETACALQHLDCMSSADMAPHSEPTLDTDLCVCCTSLRCESRQYDVDRDMEPGPGPDLKPVPVGIAPTYDFLIYAAAVGAYFKGGQLSPIDLVVEERFHRAAPGGTGGTKAAGNYSPVCLR